MIFTLLKPLIFMTFVTGFADAKVPVPSKATVTCQHCTLLKAKVNIIGKKIEGTSASSDNIVKAILDTQKAIIEFIGTAGELDDKEIEALLQAWAVVAIHDSGASIPMHPEIGDKFSNEQFRKIQTRASEISLSYCQASATADGSKEPNPPCSEYDKKLKKSYLAISLSMMEAMANKMNLERDE